MPLPCDTDIEHTKGRGALSAQQLHKNLTMAQDTERTIRRRMPIAILSALLLMAAASAPSAAQTCVGDCNGDCGIAINELILGVRISLGDQEVSACPAFDADDSGRVEINELIRAVNNALDGCGPCSPVGTPTPTPTPEPGTATPGTTTPGTATPGTATPGTVTPGTPPTETPIPPTPMGGLAVIGARAGDNTTVVVTFNGIIDERTGLDVTSYEIVQRDTPEAGGPEIFEAEFVRRCDSGPNQGEVCNDKARFGGVTSGIGGCTGGGMCTDVDRSRVVLRTAAHAMVRYTVTVTGVRDTAGNVIPVMNDRGMRVNQFEYTGAPTERLRYCVQATADATAESGRCNPVLCNFAMEDCPADDGCITQILDCDGDGLTDDVEAEGWIVTVTGLDGDISMNLVTSNPLKIDTDADGLPDGEERRANATGTVSNPRQSDTDMDGLDDFHEVGLIRSDPSKIDTDGDGLTDFAEIDEHGSSPTSPDTDGDSIPDGSDFGLGDPRIADLPAFEIQVGNATVTLIYEFNFTSDSRTIETSERMQMSTLTNMASSTTTEVDTSMSEWFAKAGTRANASAGFPAGFSASIEITAEAGIGASGSSTTTAENARTTAAEYQNTTESREELRVGETETRSVTGATLATDVTFFNVGSLAMRLSDVLITVRTGDPTNPGEFITIGQLDPPDGLPPLELGVLSDTRGPFRFSRELSERGPEFIDELMQNPRGILFDVANFSVETPVPDTSPTLFESYFTKEQDIIANNTKITIDYGGIDGRPVGEFYVSTNLGTLRAVRDTNGDGQIDSDPSSERNDIERVYRAGIERNEVLRPTLPEAVAVIGLPYTVEADPDDPDTRNFTMIDGIANVAAERKAWVVIVKDDDDDAPAVFNPLLPVDDVTLVPGRQIWIAYMQDSDGDLVPRRAEMLFGTSDANTDSDGDGVCRSMPAPGRCDSDFAEIYESYTVTFEDFMPDVMAPGSMNTYQARSNPILRDTDGDGLTDFDERVTLLTAADRVDSDGDRLPDNDPDSDVDEPGFGTNPLDQDSDDDGQSDRFRCESRTFVFQVDAIQFEGDDSSRVEYEWPNGDATLRCEDHPPQDGPLCVDDAGLCSVTIQLPGGNVESATAPPPFTQGFAVTSFTGYSNCEPPDGQDPPDPNAGCALMHCFCSTAEDCSPENPDNPNFDPPGGTCIAGRPVCNIRGNDPITEMPISTFTVDCQ